MSVYRDPDGALAGQVDAKRAVLAERARALPPLLRAVAPPPTRRLLRDPSLLEGDAPTDREALLALDERLEAALAAHDDVEARAWHLRRCPHDVPDFPRPRVPAPWLIEETPVLAFRHGLARRLEAVAPGATLLRWGDHAYLARFDVAGAPLQLFVRAKSDPNVDLGARMEGHLRSSLPETTPGLELRPEKLHHSLGKAVGVLHERAVGDARLDDAYFVEGDEDVVAALTPEVVEALLTLLPRAPRLVVGDGLVEVSWSGSWRQPDAVALPAAAVAIVCGVRRAVEG